jgi:hypothetical protein
LGKLGQLLILEVSQSSPDWQDRLFTEFTQTRLIAEKGRNEVIVYDSANTIAVNDHITFAHSCKIKPIWLGPKRTGYCFLPFRQYLDPQRNRIRKPEREIIDLRKKPNSPLEHRLQFLRQVINIVETNDVLINAKALTSLIVHDQLTEGASFIGAEERFPANTSLRKLFQACMNSSKFSTKNILLIKDSSVPDSRFSLFTQSIAQTLKQFCVPIQIYSPGFKKLEKRLSDIETDDFQHDNKSALWFLISDKSQPPTPKMTAVMERCDMLGIPWRRAHASDNFQWSITDQMPSVIQAFGHHLVRVGLNQTPLPWSLGFDISQRNTFSRACAALVDPGGNLMKSVTLDLLDKRENLDRSSIQRLVKSALAISYRFGPEDSLLIIRDGRLFESESADDYTDIFPGSISFVEFRKYNNPPMLVDQAPPQSPTVVWLNSSPEDWTGFLVTLPQCGKNEHDRVYKIHMKSSWNGIGLSQRTLAEILATLSMAPGLGLHPKALPAPIYWADGIAGASDTDLRFRGQIVTRL